MCRPEIVGRKDLSVALEGLVLASAGCENKSRLPMADLPQCIVGSE